MTKTKLTDHEDLVLALFRWGVASTPDDIAELLRASVQEIVWTCRRLERLGLIEAEGARPAA